MKLTNTEAKNVEVTVSPPSFLSLLKTHARLTELFLSHQEALLMLDIRVARERLIEFERELWEHMQFEEERLIPLYERAGRISGGQVEFFTGEHKKMLLFLGRFKERLAHLEEDPSGLKRAVIELFDDQALFKHLVEHHDQREKNILYPMLDRVTNEEERRELLYCAEEDSASVE